MLHPDSINNLILAELELQENLENPLYDFTSIIVKYSKTIEYEVYDFAKKIFSKLIERNSHPLSISYSVQGREFDFKQFFISKPNLGTIKFLFKNKEIQELLDKDIKGFINYEFNKTLDKFQIIQNHAVHTKSPTLEQTLKIRSLVVLSLAKILPPPLIPIKMHGLRSQKWQAGLYGIKPSKKM